MKNKLIERAQESCELCLAKGNLTTYIVLPKDDKDLNHQLLLCQKCIDQIDRKEPIESSRFERIPEIMWSEVPALQVVSWRLLNRLKEQTWAQDALDILYLEPEMLEWAQYTKDHIETQDVFHRDSMGNILQEGDQVVLTKTLDVKGTSFRAPLGTVVRNIRLVPNNPDQIEGRINNQAIVILTQFVRKN